MKNNYRDKLQNLLTKARPRLSSTHGLEFKNVFGAVAAYVNGHIFISCGKFGIALRLPQKTLENLFEEKDVKQLRYFPKGHIKKEYAVLPKRLLDNKARFKKLIDASIKFVCDT